MFSPVFLRVSDSPEQVETPTNGYANTARRSSALFATKSRPKAMVARRTAFDSCYVLRSILKRPNPARQYRQLVQGEIV